jgi:multidrug efflux system outer membrane protein
MRLPVGNGVRLGLTLGAAVLAGCTVGPNYHRPSVETPTAWKEPPPAGWKDASPREDISKGAWWEIFGDEELNALEIQATTQNQSLRAAAERVVEARATARIARADLFPTVTADPSGSRTRLSGNRAVAPPIQTRPYTANTFSLPLTVSYEADVWGRVRRSVEAANARTQVSVADYENLMLVLKAEVAQDYFSLRYIDADREILKNNIALLEKALDLTQVRHSGGVTSGLDVSQAQTLLETTRADLAGLARQRAQFEHALAVLIGKPASEYSLAERALSAEPPVIPPALPSELLERRPDIAEAERRMAAGNAQIGVARAAFFPQISMVGSAGYVSSSLTKLLNFPSSAWSLGADALTPIFEGGRLSANLALSRAAYDESVANYRQQVLVAFQEVEDGLSGLRVLEEQEQAQQKAVEAAQRTASISLSRYKEGLANYLDVIDAERTVLVDEQVAAQIRGLRFTTSVQLVEALGGGWKDSKIY